MQQTPIAGRTQLNLSKAEEFKQKEITNDLINENDSLISSDDSLKSDSDFDDDIPEFSIVNNKTLLS